MQVNDSERTQRIAMTQNAATKRKNDCDEQILSKQTAHGCSRTREDTEKRAVNSPVTTSPSDLVQHVTKTSPPTKHTRLCKFESLFSRSHSIDDSSIQNMSTRKMPKATIINDR